MQVVLPLVQSFLLVVATTPSDPRAISAEANQPTIETPASWSSTATPAPEPGTKAVDPPAPAKMVEQLPATPAPFVPRPQRECWTTKSQCRQLSITGIILGSLGLAATATGTALVLLPPKAIEDEPAYEMSTQPPGVVAIGMGIGVLITGVLMIVAGQRGWKLGLDRAFQHSDRGAKR